MHKYLQNHFDKSLISLEVTWPYWHIRQGVKMYNNEVTMHATMHSNSPKKYQHP